MSVNGEGQALSCCVTRRSLCGGGPVRAGDLPVAAGRADPVDLQGRLGCGALGVRALGRFQTRGPFGQSESGSASLGRASDSELEAPHMLTQRRRPDVCGLATG